MLSVVLLLFPGFLFHLISQRDSYKRESNTWSFILNTTVYSFVITFIYIGILELLDTYDHKVFFNLLINFGEKDFELTDDHHRYLYLFFKVSIIVPIIYYFLVYTQRPFSDYKEVLWDEVSIKKPIASVFLLVQLIFYIIVQTIVFLAKHIIPQYWLNIKVETQLSKVLLNNLKGDVMVYLDSGKVYIGTLMSADLNPDIRLEERYITVWPATSGYKDKNNHRLVITTIYSNKDDNEKDNDKSVKITIPLSKVSLISPFVRNITSQFIKEKSIVFDMDFKS